MDPDSPETVWKAYACPSDHDYVAGYADAMSVSLFCRRCGKGITHVVAAARLVIAEEARRAALAREGGLTQ